MKTNVNLPAYLSVDLKELINSLNKLSNSRDYRDNAQTIEEWDKGREKELEAAYDVVKAAKEILADAFTEIWGCEGMTDERHTEICRAINNL